MPTPFPGMDPYLERPSLWPNVHNSLITALRDVLTPLLRPRYFVAVQERSYLDDPFGLSFSNIPDAGIVGPYNRSAVRQRDLAPIAPATEPRTIELAMPDPMRETYLEVQEVGLDADNEVGINGTTQSARVITLLEILSPGNKRQGEGRIEYERKRRRILRSMTHLVEIDLLRSGLPMLKVADEEHDYMILVSRAEERPRAYWHPFSVRGPIPMFRLPLQEDDEEPLVDLNTILHQLYDRAGYDLRINYRAEPVPPLAEADASWADKLLRQRGYR